MEPVRSSVSNSAYYYKVEPQQKPNSNGRFSPVGRIKDSSSSDTDSGIFADSGSEQSQLSPKRQGIAQGQEGRKQQQEQQQGDSSNNTTQNNHPGFKLLPNFPLCNTQERNGWKLRKTSSLSSHSSSPSTTSSDNQHNQRYHGKQPLRVRFADEVAQNVAETGYKRSPKLGGDNRQTKDHNRPPPLPPKPLRNEPPNPAPNSSPRQNNNPDPPSPAPSPRNSGGNSSPRPPQRTKVSYYYVTNNSSSLDAEQEDNLPNGRTFDVVEGEEIEFCNCGHGKQSPSPHALTLPPPYYAAVDRIRQLRQEHDHINPAGSQQRSQNSNSRPPKVLSKPRSASVPRGYGSLPRGFSISSKHRVPDGSSGYFSQHENDLPEHHLDYSNPQHRTMNGGRAQFNSNFSSSSASNPNGNTFGSDVPMNCGQNNKNYSQIIRHKTPVYVRHAAQTGPAQQTMIQRNFSHNSGQHFSARREPNLGPNLGPRLLSARSMDNLTISTAAGMRNNLHIYPDDYSTQFPMGQSMDREWAPRDNYSNPCVAPSEPFDEIVHLGSETISNNKKKVQRMKSMGRVGGTKPQSHARWKSPLVKFTEHAFQRFGSDERLDEYEDDVNFRHPEHQEGHHPDYQFSHPNLHSTNPNHPTFPQQPPQSYTEEEMRGRRIRVRLMGLDSRGTQIMELEKLAPGPFGFFIATGLHKKTKGIFISRVSALCLESLLSVGDQILSIDNVAVKNIPLDQVQSLIANKNKITLKLLPVSMR